MGHQGLRVWFLGLCATGLALNLTALADAQSDSCPIFGTDQSELSRSTQERIFLNFEGPSQCRGNVTSWRFCFYNSRVGGGNDEGSRSSSNSNNDDNAQYGVKFMVYRRPDLTSDSYMPVPGSITSQLLMSNNVGSTFQCMTVAATQRFEIQENDIVGACIQNQGSVNPLYLIGDTNDINSNQKLYQYDSSGYEGCTSEQIGNVDTGNIDFRQRNELILHLYTITDVAAMYMCRAGSNPPATGPLTSTVSGTYLNTMDTAMCSDHITSWHYCYYPSAAPVGQTYTMTVAAWRLDAGMYQLIQGTSRTITLTPIETNAKIFCKEEALDPVDYVLVCEGDVIGVVLPSTNPIPVVSSNAGSGSSLRRHPQNTSPTDLLGTEFTEMSDTSLHVYAKLGNTDEDQTSGVSATTMTMDTPAPQPRVIATGEGPGGTSNSTSSEGQASTVDDSILSAAGSGLSSGNISAIILSLIAVAMVLIVATLFLFLCIQRKRKNIKTSAWSAIDNVAYDVSSGMVNIKEKPKFEGHYESIDEDHIPVSLQGASAQKLPPGGIDQIYQEIDEGDVVYSSPTVRDYQECLEEAKRGVVSGEKEDPYAIPSSNETAIYTAFKKLKIHTLAGFSIEIGDKLGSGQFGTVSKAVWKQPGAQQIEVAVKTLKDDASQIDRIKFLQEAAIMAQFKHPNVVALYGIAQKAGKRMILVELLSKGDLQSYLKTLRPDPGELVPVSIPQMLLEYCQQIALGMSYLANKGFVHRDLAARNILLSDNNICKIADFGMSRDLQDADYYVSTGGKIPLKWTAPEALHYKKYSTASDVWSYGCVLYEIWSLGTKPYEGMGNIEVLRVIEAGIRLAPPPGCPQRVYEIMIQCWAKDPSSRPEFRGVLLSLLENKGLVLKIPLEDMSSHPLAGVLGAPLVAGHKMYTTAQNRYAQSANSTIYETPYK